MKITPITLTIDNLSHDGRGVAKRDGKTVFVEGALPQETVQVQITRSKANYDEAVCKQVISPAKTRVTPACPHFGSCGGCVLQHLESAAQVQEKEKSFLYNLKKIAKSAPVTLLPPLYSEPWHYRHRARLHVAWKNQRPIVGFKTKQNASEVLQIQQCPILVPSLARLLPDLPALLSSLKQKPAIRHILMVSDEKQVQLLLKGYVFDEKDNSALQAFEAKHQCVILNRLSTWPDLTYPVYDKNAPRLQFSIEDFTQVNPRLNAKMLASAKHMMKLSEKDGVADFFSGIGNFSLAIAPSVNQVFSAEYGEKMVEKAKKNALNNQLPHLIFQAVDLEKKQKVQAFLKQHPANKVVLDPPRAGAKILVESLNPKQVKGILYVSCHPATFARDTAYLVHQKGYVLKQLQVIDMFPHTEHLEVMAWFCPKPMGSDSIENQL